MHREPGTALARLSGRAEDIPAAELYLTDHQRGHKSPSDPFQAVGSTKLYLSYPDSTQAPRGQARYIGKEIV